MPNTLSELINVYYKMSLFRQSVPLLCLWLHLSPDVLQLVPHIFNGLKVRQLSWGTSPVDLFLFDILLCIACVLRIIVGH